MLTILIHLFEQIPSSFWGIVFGSIISLGGVFLTNRAGDRRLSAQFEHERLQKTKDREMALRTEVFLDAAEAISAGMKAISRISNLDLTNDQIIGDYSEKSPAIAKVHVIANSETIESIAHFVSELESLYLRLFARRFVLVSEKNDIQLIDNQVAEFGKERDRFLEMIKQYNIEDAADPRRWKVLQDNFQFEQDRITNNLSHRAELVEKLRPKHLEFLRDCVNESALLSMLIVPVLKAVRTELELQFDDHTYRTLLNESASKLQHAIEDFMMNVAPTADLSLDPDPGLAGTPAPSRTTT